MPGRSQPGTAFALLRSGSYEEAVDAFRAVLRSGQDATVRKGLVAALAEIGRYEDAEEAARDGDAAALANTLGEVMLVQGRRADAEAAFRAALSGAAADSLDARKNLGLLLLARGDREGAQAELRRFFEYYNTGVAKSAEELVATAEAVRALGATDPQLFHDALRALDEALAADPEYVEARLLIGELFTEKYQFGEAKAAYEEVLAANPRQPRALAGLAAAKQYDGGDEPMEHLRAALEVNPNLVRARVALARMFVGGESFDAARREAETALEVDGGALEALGVLAAVRMLVGDGRGYDELRSRALEVDSAPSEFYSTVAELMVQNRRYAEAVALAREAVAADAVDWRAWGLLGLNELRLGQVDNARASLQRAFAGDPFNVWVKNSLDLMDTYANFATVSTDNFQLFLEGPEAELVAVYLEPLAEEAFAALGQRYGYTPVTPVRVEVYPSHADFSVRTVGLAGLGALGVAFGNVLAMDSPKAREAGAFNWGSTFWHELAHTVTLGITNHAVPRWLTEGISVAEERRARPGWGDDPDLSFLLAVTGRQLLPVAELNRGFTRPSYPSQVQHAYLQASLVVELIEQEWGFGAVRSMLEGYRDGRGTEAIFRDVLDESPEDFDERFAAFLDERYGEAMAGLPQGDAAVDLQASRTLAAGARPDEDDFMAQMAYGAQLLRDGNEEGARRHLERARELFPGHAPTGDGPWLALARMAEERGDLRGAIRELSGHVAVNESDYEAHLELTRLHEAVGDSAAAARVLASAMYIWPYDMEQHQRLALLHRAAGDRQGEVRERRAIVALAPVDMAQARYELAAALHRAGDSAAARTEVLKALEIAPSFADAQRLLLELRRGGGGP